MTRRDKLEDAVYLLGQDTGQRLELHTQDPGDGRRYWITTTGKGNYYSPRLPIAELERLVEFGLKVAADVHEESF